jgi:hypothetical protein
MAPLQGESSYQFKDRLTVAVLKGEMSANTAMGYYEKAVQKNGGILVW